MNHRKLKNGLKIRKSIHWRVFLRPAVFKKFSQPWPASYTCEFAGRLIKNFEITTRPIPAERDESDLNAQTKPKKTIILKILIVFEKPHDIRQFSSRNVMYYIISCWTFGSKMNAAYGVPGNHSLLFSRICVRSSLLNSARAVVQQK